MAKEENEGKEKKKDAKDGSFESPEKAKCPPCPAGLPGWLATFSDLVTLLLTFFILLLSFAKSETAKYESALGSIRNSFGGYALKQGEVSMMGKSPSNAFTMMESSEPANPFPIEYLTSQGLLEQKEINRNTDEELEKIKTELARNDLSHAASLEEIQESIKVKFNDSIFFQKGSIQLEKIPTEIFERVIEMIKENKISIYLEGHASLGETSVDGQQDSYSLSFHRSMAVASALIRRGVSPQQITVLSYGDTRPNEAYTISDEESQKFNRRVEIYLKKQDLRTPGQKVNSF